MLLSLKEIQEELKSMIGWVLDGGAITKEFVLKDFKSCVEFLNKINELAERIQHHPDVVIYGNTLRLTLETHAFKGLTKKDFELAKEIDNLEK